VVQGAGLLLQDPAVGMPSLASNAEVQSPALAATQVVSQGIQWGSWAQAARGFDRLHACPNV
jgi:hypothetical protein